MHSSTDARSDLPRFLSPNAVAKLATLPNSKMHAHQNLVLQVLAAKVFSAESILNK